MFNFDSVYIAAKVFSHYLPDGKIEPVYFQVDSEGIYISHESIEPGKLGINPLYHIEKAGWKWQSGTWRLKSKQEKIISH